MEETKKEKPELTKEELVTIFNALNVVTLTGKDSRLVANLIDKLKEMVGPIS